MKKRLFNGLTYALSIVAAICAAPAGAYTISYDTGNGSEATWGTADYTGDFEFIFPSGVNALTFYGPIQLNANNVDFIVPSGKTGTLVGGVANSGGPSTSDTSDGSIYRFQSDGNDGTLVVSGGIDSTRLHLRRGTTIIDARNRLGVTNVLNRCYVWGSGKLVFNGGAYEGYGKIYQEGGEISATNCYFARRSANSGDIDIAQGTFSTVDCIINNAAGGCTLKIGGVYSSQNAYAATYNMDGGSLLMHRGVMIGYTGTGTFNLRDGLVLHDMWSQDWPQVLGYFADAVGTLNISGGEWRILGARWNENLGRCTVHVGYNGTGTVNISGTGVFSSVPVQDGVSKAAIYVAKNAGSAGTVNLNEGGSFVSWGNGPTGGEGTSALVFNGGTFQRPSGASAVFDAVEENMTTVAVGPKGGAVDTGTGTLKFHDPIVDLDPDAVPEGFFWKRGSGTLWLAGENTYHAPTRIADGILALSAGASLSSNSVLWVDAGVTVDLSGAAAQTVGGLAGRGTVANVSLATSGPICPGGTNEVGTLTLANCPLTLAPGSRLVVDTDAQGNCDTLVVTGTSTPLDISNLVIEVAGAGADAEVIGPIIQCPAGVTGAPRRVVGTKSSHASIRVGGTTVRLTRPSTVLILR